MISLITVCFNSAATIKETLDSIYFQSYNNFEHLIIDGGSTDQTLEICKNHPLNSKIVSDNDHGIYDAMNKGLELANGDFIGFLNSDDVFYDNNSLKYIAEGFSNFKVKIVYGDLAYYNSDLSGIVRNWYVPPFRENFILEGNIPPHPTFYFHKSLLTDNLKFNLSYRLAADFDFMLRLLLGSRSFEVFKVEKTLVKMRMGGVTNSSFKNIFFQNLEIFHSLRSNGIRGSLVLFFIRRVLIKVKQLN